MKKYSFFSYKGGSGRSTLAYNTIPFLVKELNASPKAPILVFDLDIDSAGLTFLFKKSGVNTDAFSIQEALDTPYSIIRNNPDTVDIEHHAIFKSCIPIGRAVYGLDEDNDRSVLFVPTKRNIAIGGDGNGNYVIGGDEERRFKRIIEDCDAFGFSAVLFDTPAGNQATAQWSLEISDAIVVCMRITYQMREGTREYLDMKLKNFSNKKVFIVPNAVPTDEIFVDGYRVDYEYLKGTINDMFKDISINDNQINLEMLGVGKPYFGINEIKRFKIQEDVLFKIAPEKRSGDENSAIEAYRRLATLLK